MSVSTKLEVIEKDGKFVVMRTIAATKQVQAGEHDGEPIYNDEPFEPEPTQATIQDKSEWDSQEAAATAATFLAEMERGTNEDGTLADAIQVTTPS